MEQQPFESFEDVSPINMVIFQCHDSFQIQGGYIFSSFFQLLYIICSAPRSKNSPTASRLSCIPQCHLLLRFFGIEFLIVLAPHLGLCWVLPPNQDSGKTTRIMNHLLDRESRTKILYTFICDSYWVVDRRFFCTL